MRIDFIVFKSLCHKLSYVHLFVVVLSLIAKGEDCLDICDLMLVTYVILELANPLTKHTLFVTG